MSEIFFFFPSDFSEIFFLQGTQVKVFNAIWRAIILPVRLLCDNDSISVVTVASCFVNGEISWNTNCSDLAVFKYLVPLDSFSQTF